MRHVFNDLECCTNLTHAFSICFWQRQKGRFNDEERNATRMRGMHGSSDATYKAVVQAAKVRSYDSPSAFMRAAVEKELRGPDATLDESEQRITATLPNGIRNKFGG